MSWFDIYSLESTPQSLSEALTIVRLINSKGKPTIPKFGGYYTTTEIKELIKVIEDLKMTREPYDIYLGFSAQDDLIAKKIKIIIEGELKDYPYTINTNLSQVAKCIPQILMIDSPVQYQIGIGVGLSMDDFENIPEIPPYFENVKISWELSEIKGHEELHHLEFDLYVKEAEYNIILAGRKLSERDIAWIEPEWGLKFIWVKYQE